MSERFTVCPVWEPQVVVPEVSSSSNGAVNELIPHTAITSTARPAAASDSGAVSCLFTRCSFVDLVHPGVHDVPLLQGSPQGTVQPVLEVQVVAPLHDVREQVA